jgi:hypothetical protein
VITIMDLKAELANRTMLRGRTPETPTAARERAFAKLAPYRDGATRLRTMTAEEPESFRARSGGSSRKGCGRGFGSPFGVSLMTATPQPTEHLTVAVANPRTPE